MADNQSTQEEQLRQLVDERMKDINLIAAIVSMTHRWGLIQQFYCVFLVVPVISSKCLEP